MVVLIPRTDVVFGRAEFLKVRDGKRRETSVLYLTRNMSFSWFTCSLLLGTLCAGKHPAIVGFQNFIATVPPPPHPEADTFFCLRTSLLADFKLCLWRWILPFSCRRGVYFGNLRLLFQVSKKDRRLFNVIFKFFVLCVEIDVKPISSTPRTPPLLFFLNK